MSVERLIVETNGVKPGRYDASFVDIAELSQYARKNGTMEALTLAFRYGFFKGQKAAKKEAAR